MKSILTGAALDAALKALAECRLWWRVSDQYGGSCNGGGSFRLDPASPGVPGEWAKKISNPRVCSRGYHVTSDPIRWAGVRVALVEIDAVGDRVDNKAVCGSLRELGAVDPFECVDDRIRVAAMRPFMYGADLRGADLGGANLRGANLSVADLSVADLRGTNLDGANLRGTYLRGADLDGWEIGDDGFARRK